MFLVSACTCLCPIHWSQLSSREYVDVDVDVEQIYCPLRCYYIIGLAVYYPGCRICLPPRCMFYTRLLLFAMCFVTKPLQVIKGMAPFVPPVWLLVNTLRPGQNGRHFPDDIFKRIFLNQNGRFPINISLEFVPRGQINNIPALVQIMARRRPGDNPLSETMLVSLLTHICVTRPQWINPLSPSDAICQHSACLKLAQVMAWCLTTRSRQLVQCWLLINTVLWPLLGVMSERVPKLLGCTVSLKTRFRLLAHLSGAGELKRFTILRWYVTDIFTHYQQVKN